MADATDRCRSRIRHQGPCPPGFIQDFQEQETQRRGSEVLESPSHESASLVRQLSSAALQAWLKLRRWPWGYEDALKCKGYDVDTIDVRTALQAVLGEQATTEVFADEHGVHIPGVTEDRFREVLKYRDVNKTPVILRTVIDATAKFAPGTNTPCGLPRTGTLRESGVRLREQLMSLAFICFDGATEGANNGIITSVIKSSESTKEIGLFGMVESVTFIKNGAGRCTDPVSLDYPDCHKK